MELPDEYWVIDTANCRFFVSPDTAVIVLRGMIDGGAVAQIKDIFNGQINLSLRHVQALFESTPEIRANAIRMQNLRDREGEMPEWEL